MTHSHHHSGAHHHGSHGGHAHEHDIDRSGRRLTLALLILGTFSVVAAFCGYIANSIALLAEAAHMLADSASLLLAVIAVRAARRPADARRTYGHRRYQPLAAFINGQLLLLLTLWVVYEAAQRLLHAPAVNGRLMLGIALLGGAANFVALLALSGGRSLNERGARAHVMSDLLGSAAASLAAIVIILKGWTIADPLLSLVISALILRSAWAIMRESADVLLEGVPTGFDVSHIEAELLGHIPGLIGVHHVHVWTMTGERPTVTLHAHLAPGAAHGDALWAIHTRLAQRLKVEHTTVQIEEAGTCQSPECGPPR
ncbi:MAG: cation transporter [Sinobacteraceae bacterium]|nr:cation transporter [Nevskiaceae bacterium]MBV9316590.1 cation transporter [Gammaproteobacteria bacterium]